MVYIAEQNGISKRDSGKEYVSGPFRHGSTDVLKSADKLSMKSLETPGNLASRTTILLHGATNYFDRTQPQPHLSTGLSPSPSLGSRTRPRLGVAPWHRRHSHDSVLSVSSSVRDLLRGKTPIATPVPEGSYVGPNGERYPTGIYVGARQHRIRSSPLYHSATSKL